MRLYAAALCAALLPGLAAHAATITSYSSQDAFAAASSTRVIDNFSGITNYKFGRTYDDGRGIVFSLPVTTPIASTFYVFNGGYHNSVSASNAKYLEALGTPSSTVETLTFNPSSAIGFSLGSTFGAKTINVLIDGTSYSIDAPIGYGNQVFAGFTSAGTFSSVTLSVNTPQIDLVQVFLGNATTTLNATAITPEPSSLVLLGTGLLGVVGVVRKRLA